MPPKIIKRTNYESDGQPQTAPELMFSDGQIASQTNAQIKASLVVPGE